jgi:hypothetical protein
VVSLSLAPLYGLAALILLVVCSAVFIRVAEGRYAEALIARGMRIRTLGGRAVRSYVKDLEKANPEAARALQKVERVCGARSFPPGEAALSVLTDSERRAYLELFDDQVGRPRNRAQRRHSQGSAQRPRSRLIR